MAISPPHHPIVVPTIPTRTICLAPIDLPTRILPSSLSENDDFLLNRFALGGCVSVTLNALLAIYQLLALSVAVGVSLP